MVQPIQLAFQQQIQSLKTQHEEFVVSLKQQPPPASVAQLAAPVEPEKTSPLSSQPGEETHPPPKSDTRSQFYFHVYKTMMC